MKIIEIDSIYKTNESEFINKSIKNGGIFIYPTDTLYGIGGDFYSHEVLKKIDEIKNRFDKPYSVAVSDFEMLKKIVKNIPEIFYKKYLDLLPGKYTFLFEISDSINRKLVKGSEKIGVRIPDAPEILRLIKNFENPIITTSVNEAGETPLNSFKKIIDFIDLRGLKDEISFIVDGGELPSSGGSAIIDLTKDRPEYIR